MSQPQRCSLTHSEMLVKETKIFKLIHRFAHNWIDGAKLRFFHARFKPESLSKIGPLLYDQL